MASGQVLTVQIDPIDGSIVETEEVLRQASPIRIIKPVSSQNFVIVTEGGKSWQYNGSRPTPLLCSLWDVARLNDRLWLGVDLNGVAVIYHLGDSQWSRKQVSLPSKPRRLVKGHPSMIACLCHQQVELFGPSGEQLTSLSVSKPILSGCWLQWHGKPEQWFLALGHADAISIYSTTWQLAHQTETAGEVRAMAAIGGMLLAGVGNVLRLYDLGIKRLLRKAECRVPHGAVALETQGWRIFALDLHAGPMVGQWRAEEGRLVIQADDILPRPSTQAMAVLDYDTLIGADRVGNVFVSRWSAHLPTENIVAAGKQENLFGAAMRLDRLVEFYLGDTIVHLCKLQDRLAYVTCQGAIGWLVPLRSKKKAQVLQSLESSLRSRHPSPLSRDHLAYRSYWVPTKGVIDGALCAQYDRLPASIQLQVADELESGATTPAAIQRLLKFT